MAGQRGRRTGMGNEGEELVAQLKRIFTALQSIATANIGDPRRGRDGRYRPGFFNEHIRTRARGSIDLVRSAGAASPYGVARGISGVAMGPMGMAATVAGAGIGAGMTAARFTGERLNRLSRPGEVSSLKSAELQSAVVDKATLGIGGGWLRAAWNVTGYTDMQTAVSATRDDVMGLARSAFEAGITPKKGYIEGMAQARFNKNKEWIERRDEVLEAVDKVTAKDVKRERGEVDDLVSQVPVLGGVISKVTTYFEELASGMESYRQLNKALSGVNTRD